MTARRARRIDPGPHAVIRYFTFGGYRNRQPLAYDPVRAELGARVAPVQDPAEAQILLVSHHADFDLFGPQIQAHLARVPGLRLVLLSEEPYWDSCWMPDPFSRRQAVQIETGAGRARLPCTVLNHATSGVFRAARIPYFLLTDAAYVARYRILFDRNAGWGAQDWLRHFRTCRWDAVFLAERRQAAQLAPVHRGDEMRGLSVWRSRLAEASRGARVVVDGRGWPAAGPRRQDLPDWHADKLERFDRQTRYMSAIENTHQAEYVTEKIYDAFAMGAVPLYAAGPGHAVHRLVGAGGWLNLFGGLGTEHPVFDATVVPDLALAEDYARRQQALAALFGDPGILAAEYARLADALLDEFRRVLSDPP